MKHKHEMRIENAMMTKTLMGHFKIKRYFDRLPCFFQVGRFRVVSSFENNTFFIVEKHILHTIGTIHQNIRIVKQKINNTTRMEIQKRSKTKKKTGFE